MAPRSGLAATFDESMRRSTNEPSIGVACGFGLGIRNHP